MSESKEGKDGPAAPDPRVNFIQDRLQRAFTAVKADKFGKAFGDPENITRVEEFLNNPDVRVLTYYGDTLTSVHGLPKKAPRGASRIVYFLKTRACVVTKEAPGADIVVSDMTAEPLEHLEKVLSEVYIPLLSNPANQEGWGDVASKEIVERLHSFLAHVSITVGQTRGETCLPLPSLDTATAAHMSPKDRVHLLEGAVITWTKQIRGVLRREPEELLKAGGTGPSAHPTPDAEVAFWREKAGHLNAIYDQLQSERVRRVLHFLDAAKSTYCTPFAKLCRDVFAARLEANDNVKYLRTLETWFARLIAADSFESLPDLYRPIMHTLLLIWKNSKHYNTPARLVVVIREVCNAVIAAAQRYVSGKAVLEMLAEESGGGEAVVKLGHALRVCSELKRAFFAYKATANAEVPANPWRIQNTALFLRLDRFIERCHDVSDMATTVLQFDKLERVVIGGTKGESLTASVQAIHRDFRAGVAAFEHTGYDLLDPEQTAFDADYHAFRARVKDLERRLAAVLTQAFDDCVSIYSRFKLLDSLEGLLERPTIADELERKHIALVQAYAADLKRVQEILLTERDNPPIAWNLPPIAGALFWCRGLKERIAEPMARLRGLNRSIMGREEAKEVVKIYSSVMSGLDDFEHAKVEEWAADVERVSTAKLRLPLLTRSGAGMGSVALTTGGSEANGTAPGQADGVGGAPGTGPDGMGMGASGPNPSPPVSAGGTPQLPLLSVNFDPSLVRLLREVKYFLLLGLSVPDTAVEIHKRADTFRRHTGSLDLCVGMYNAIMRELLPVEAPLVRGQLERIDAVLVQGIRDLNWQNTGAIDAFIGEAHSSVSAVFEMMVHLKGNLRDVCAEMDAWAKEPLLVRRPKPMAVDEMEAVYRTARAQRYLAIQAGGALIREKLKDSAAVMKVPKGKERENPHWAAYVDFVNGIVVQGLARLVVASMRRLVDIVATGTGAHGHGEGGGKAAAGAKADKGGSSSSSSSSAKGTAIAELPMLIVDLTLANTSNGQRVLRFVPDVSEDVVHGGATLYDLADGWVDSFFHAAAVFQRLDDGEGTYVKELVDDPEVQLLLATLHDALCRSEQVCLDFRTRFDAFSHLWRDNMGDAFQAFCQRAYVEVEVAGEGEKGGDDQAGEGAAASDGKEGDGKDKAAAGQPAAASAGASGGGASSTTITVPDLAAFDAEIARFKDLGDAIAAIKTPVDLGWLRVSCQPMKSSLSTLIAQWVHMFTAHVQAFLVSSVEDMAAFVTRTMAGLEEDPMTAPPQEAKASLRRCMAFMRDVRKTGPQRKALIDPLHKAVALLRKHGVHVEEARMALPGAASGTGTGTAAGAGVSVIEYLDQADLKLEACTNRAYGVKEAIRDMRSNESLLVREAATKFEDKVRDFWNGFRKNAPFTFTGPPDQAYVSLDAYYASLVALEAEARVVNEEEELFEVPVSTYVEMGQCRQQLRLLKVLWDFKAMVLATYEAWRQQLWTAIDTGYLEDVNKRIMTELRKLGDTNPIVKAWGVFKDTDALVKDMNVTIPLVDKLHSPAMRDRHWKTLCVSICGVRELDVHDPKFSLDALIDLKLHAHSAAVEELVDSATKELKIEKKMDEIEAVWRASSLEYYPHKESEVRLPRASDEIMENLDAHQMELITIVGMGAVVNHFATRVQDAQRSLGVIEEVLKEWLSVSKAWASLESIFLASADIRAQLPDDTKRFEGIDAAFKDLMKAAVETPNVKEACEKEGRGDLLKEMTKNLELCQKSLNEYLDTKKKMFPRFYFVSNVALLDILSNGNNPPKIMQYVGDCYDSIANLVFEAPVETGAIPNVASQMIAKDGERVAFYRPFVMAGAVENWLNDLTVMQQDSLRYILEQAIETAVNWEVEKEKTRDKWLEDYPAQIVLVGTQIYWTEETQAALDELEGGQEDAVKKYRDLCSARLDALIARVLDPDMDPDLRTKIVSLITMDVHARDVVQKLIDQKAEGQSSFLWSQQLRFYWQPDTRDVNVAITDFRSKYFYEWVGNSGRLVITPLTDRCYITLTMALRLVLGGAPAGPAGTGKTETTKDLARALALPCYVFNCSDQMTYQTLGDIFKGLAQTGAWGCFDEFNRIGIEVLSVVATQVKSILDACVRYANPANREPQYQHLPAGSPPVVVGTFELGGDTINVIPTVGMFITMNPGYAGRTELPENLKALFRSCAMIRPDLMLICENMLMSEGFKNARPLSVKFVTLYQLASELLSPQAHYDWGLRAVKSVLRVAGKLKREDVVKAEGAGKVGEDGVLKRALRDFNTPKMPTADLPIFTRLIEDLFPRLPVETVFRPDLQKLAIQAAKEHKPIALQHDPVFIAKVVNLQDIMDVRHSVMLVGPAGAGKTTVWKTLAAAHNLGKPKNRAPCHYEVVDPKAVTGNELYGYMTLAREWKDGVLSIIMRGMSKNFKELGYGPHQTMKWVVLDGDIDAVWIESMNTVMDDNKVLTLVSNERIPLSAAMRMVFEVNSLANATPATVSRAGILFLNDTDVGWRPYMETWLAGLTVDAVKAHLPGFFDKYIEPISEGMRRGMKTGVPLPLINQVMTVCRLMEGYLDKLPPPKEGGGGRTLVDTLEHLFYTAVMWAFGGALITEVVEEGKAGQSGNHRLAFHSLLTQLGANIKLSKESGGDDTSLCFDYFYNPQTEEMTHWSTLVPPYTPIPIGDGPGDVSFSSLVVPTVDSTRLTSLLDQLVRKGHPVMFVGNAGTGKTTLVRSYLTNLTGTDDSYLATTVTMNYYMDSAALQVRIDGAIDRRSGRLYGPPTGKRMLFYIDDMNLPYIEDYGTQNSLSLLRQIMDHKSYFDRADLGFRKEVADCGYLASMNPTAGSFTVTERLQRLYSTFACLMPGEGDLNLIYKSILNGHLRSFVPDVQRLADPLTDASIKLHKAVSERFLPDAERFMYNWNMRELANIYQGLTLVNKDMYTQPLRFVRLWAHEACRVFGDRMVDAADSAEFVKTLKTVIGGVFKDTMKVDDVLAEPLVFTSFSNQVNPADPTYLPLPLGEAGYLMLSQDLMRQLDEYNEKYSVMDLVLFQQAMEHICRIARIIRNPAGNAMLIGVGGSGKQSLSRLAAFICGYQIRQLQVTAKFGVNELKESLKEMYKLAGVKAEGVVFLLTDSQIVNDKFLVYINDMLASGWIADLFEQDEIDAVFNALRNEARASGVVTESVDEMLRFFVSRVRANLHLVLCFSPVGATFRVRARRFPGLINCTVIDRFHPWPKEALVSVAARFIDDLDLTGPEVTKAVAAHMAEVHQTVTDISREFQEKMRRYNYTTPKSFLELIDFYRSLLDKKREQSQKLIRRLDDGLAKLKKTQDDVDELSKDVERAKAKALDEVEKTDALVKKIAKESAEAAVEKDAAAVVAGKAAETKAAATEIEAQATMELDKAQPALDQARAALAGLSKKSISVLKSLPNPPAGVEKVTAACIMILEKEYSNAKAEKWDKAQKSMSNPDAFLKALSEFDATTMPNELVAKLEGYVGLEVFTEEVMKQKSEAAAGLCSYVRNMYKFNRIFVQVDPLVKARDEARIKLAAAEAELAAANEKVARIEANLAKLEADLAKANATKLAAEADAARCEERLGLANRLVGGLKSENDRWGIEVEKLRQTEIMLIGDVLLGSAFVSYIGAFDHAYRNRLWQHTWLPDLTSRGIPISPGSDPLNMLTDEGSTAKMLNEGLPADRISIENGSIICASKRWPLIIDPQLQGIKWLKRKEGERKDGAKLLVIQLTQPNWIKPLMTAVTQGNPVIIENVGEDIDATLEPVLARAIIASKSGPPQIRLGGEPIDYDARFRLYLQTKLPNPHYRPEIQAQCTIVNFIATEAGLLDQLLARVVKEEKSVLEERKTELAAAFNSYKMQLLALEDNLLTRLAEAPDDILSDVSLIEGLEATKKAVIEINAAVEKGKQTEEEINIARRVYIPVADEGAMLYFMISALNNIEHMYQYSLDSFMIYFYKAIREAPKSEDDHVRVQSLRETLRLAIYTWVARGLFERHKLILLSQLCFELMRRGKLKDVDEFHLAGFQFLLRGPRKLSESRPAALDWLQDPEWFALQALADLEGGEFAKLPSDLSEAPTRFKEWFNHVTPESEKLPLDWSALDKTPFKKLLVLRCLRPDRLNIALRDFVANTLPAGSKFVDCDATFNSTGILKDSLRDATPQTPIYFILSPGADVVADVDRLAEEAKKEKGKSYFNVSMGQGQDVVAMEKLDAGFKNGYWVLLNNVHLMPKWLVELEKKLDAFAAESQGRDNGFRIFLTSDPSLNIPIGILNRSIKLTNEPPQGLKANLKRAFCIFSAEYINDIDAKMRAILFGLCHFHAVMIERKKFGSKGFNMMYPFSLGDLRDSAVCLQNYMENATGKIPWDDLRYIFGQIMYGGHIVNDFDRLLCVTYLEHFLRDELLDEMELFPYNRDEKGATFKSPSPTTYDRYLEHIETEFKGDTPIAFGLHPNAEIGFRTEQSETLLRTLLELQPRDSSSGGGEDKSFRSMARNMMTEIMDTFGETGFPVDDIVSGMESVGPFQNVLILEMKQMNVLLGQIRKSLGVLRLGFDGKLTMSEEMEKLEMALALEKVPVSWAKLAWPSMRPLSSWKSNLAFRIGQLNDWAAAPMEPLKVTTLSWLINPQSFLTAIRQQTAQRTAQELDKLVILTEVTKRKAAEIEGPSKDGCYIDGLYMQGARFDIASLVVDRSRPREMDCEMPVINCKAVPVDKIEEKGTYQCPVYRTEQRGPTFIFLAQLKTKSPAARWIMAGVALILDIPSAR